jgi:hypothetical protein
VAATANVGRAKAFRARIWGGGIIETSRVVRSISAGIKKRQEEPFFLYCPLGQGICYAGIDPMIVVSTTAHASARANVSSRHDFTPYVNPAPTVSTSFLSCHNCTMSSAPVFKIIPGVQSYAWGKKGSSSLAAQLGERSIPDFSIDDEKPYAEVSSSSPTLQPFHTDCA